MPALEALDLLLDLLRGLLGDLLLRDLLAVRRDLLGEVLGLAELLLDRLELLAQEVLALALVDLALGGAGDLLLDRQDAHLAPQDLEDGLEALDGRDRLEDLLGLLDLELEVRGREVREARGLVEARRRRP